MTANKKVIMEDGVIIEYKDVITAFDGIKAAIFNGKGACTAKIAAHVFGELEKNGINTYFIKMNSANSLLCRKTEAIPLQMIVRNRICGTTAKFLGLEDGTEIKNTVFELRLKNDLLGNPMINEDHAVAIGIADYDTLAGIKAIALKANEILKSYFTAAGIELVDFKMEIGRDEQGSLCINDDLSPDTCRLWDIESGRKLDKDRFRHDLSDVNASYQNVLERLESIE